MIWFHFYSLVISIVTSTSAVSRLPDTYCLNSFYPLMPIKSEHIEIHEVNPNKSIGLLCRKILREEPSPLSPVRSSSNRMWTCLYLSHHTVSFIRAKTGFILKLIFVEV